MFAALLDWLWGEEEDDATVDETAEPGTRVRCTDDGSEGVLSAIVSLDGRLYARVIFTTYRASWVDVVAAERLELTERALG